MPRIWLDYCQFIVSQCKITRSRRTFDRALRALPITQHSRIWPLYLKFARNLPLPETAIRVYRRYLKVCECVYCQTYCAENLYLYIHSALCVTNYGFHFTYKPQFIVFCPVCVCSFCSAFSRECGGVHRLLALCRTIGRGSGPTSRRGERRRLCFKRRKVKLPGWFVFVSVCFI